VLKMDLLDELGRRVGRACGGEMAGQERGEDGGQVRGQARSQVRNQVRSDVSFRFDLVVAGTRALAYGAQVEVRSGAPLSPPARACLEEAVADGIELRTEQPRYPAFSGTATLLLASDGGVGPHDQINPGSTGRCHSCAPKPVMSRPMMRAMPTRMLVWGVPLGALRKRPVWSVPPSPMGSLPAART
jgi:hypothetical protein